MSKILTPEEARDLVMKIRAGDSRSKNKGRVYREPDTGALKLVRLPLAAFRQDIIEWMRDSTNPDRVAEYAAETRPFPPIYMRYNQRGQLTVGDGGHRLLAALDRGDRYIEALVPADYDVE